MATKIKTDQALVNSNKELTRRFESKIKTVVNRMWSDKNYPSQLGENP